MTITTQRTDLSSVAATGLRPGTATTVDLTARFEPIFALIGADNVARERGRVFGYEQVQLLKDAGFGTLRIPVAQGGLGASLSQTFELLALLAEHDPNVAHVWRNHLAFVEDRLNAAPSATTDRWIERFVAGDFVGGGWTEANNGTFATTKTTVNPAADGSYRVSGAKFYATGSLYADWLDVMGRSESGDYLTALVPRHQDGVELRDDWDGFGQQTTASGSASYAGARVDAGDVYPASERFAYQGHFYQNALLAVLTGIARAARRDAVGALQRRGRNYPQGLHTEPRHDAQLLQVIGEVSAAVFGAQAALSLSLASLDATSQAAAAGDPAALRAALIEGEIATAQAQLVIIEAALSVTTKIFDALGASGTSVAAGLDRHWRNARTLASHNPRVYKARILGDWLVNDADPVPNLAAPGRGGQGN